ncbi:hypothetical protein PENTCL1PPCAC_17485, partial [Pristionchus entomophagus]
SRSDQREDERGPRPVHYQAVSFSLVGCSSPGALPSSSSFFLAYTQNETSYYHLLQLKQQRKRLFRRLK